MSMTNKGTHVHCPFIPLSYIHISLQINTPTDRGPLPSRSRLRVHPRVQLPGRDAPCSVRAEEAAGGRCLCAGRPALNDSDGRLPAFSPPAHTHASTTHIHTQKTMGVPHRIEVGAADTKLPGEDRIDFLVRMRNEALAPLFSRSVGR